MVLSGDVLTSAIKKSHRRFVRNETLETRQVNLSASASFRLARCPVIIGSDSGRAGGIVMQGVPSICAYRESVLLLYSALTTVPTLSPFGEPRWVFVTRRQSPGEN